MKTCLAEWIGDDAKGKLCFIDDDCISIYGKGSCDRSVNRCIDVRQEMERQFVECVFNQTDSILRSAIFVQLSSYGFIMENSSRSNLTVDVLMSYLMESDCVSDYGPMSVLRRAYVSTSITDTKWQLCETVTNDDDF
jgi:hypothetical protein